MCVFKLRNGELETGGRNVKNRRHIPYDPPLRYIVTSKVHESLQQRLERISIRLLASLLVPNGQSLCHPRTDAGSGQDSHTLKAKPLKVGGACVVTDLFGAEPRSPGPDGPTAPFLKPHLA